MAVRDIDRGMNRIRQELAKLKEQEVVVGLQAGDRTKDGKVDIAYIGSIQEYGAVIRHKARAQVVYHRLNKNGSFARKGKFSKAGRSNFSRTAAVGEHTTVIPERPFMRSTYDEQNRKWNDAAQRLIGKIADGKGTADETVAVLGNMIQGDVQRKIVAGPFTPNAPATIRSKKSSRPLIDSGQMRQSIRWIVRRRGSGKVRG